MKTPPRFASRRRPPVEPQPYFSPYPRRLLLMSLALIALLASWGTVQAVTSGKSEPTTHMPPYSPLPTGDYSFPAIPGVGNSDPTSSPSPAAEPALTLSSPRPSPTTTSLHLADAKPAASPPAVLAAVAPVLGQVSVRSQNGTAGVSVALSAPQVPLPPVQPAALPTPSPAPTPLLTPSQPAPTPTPTPVSTPTPTPTPTPVPTATPTPTPKPTPTATPTAKPTAASNQRGENR